MITTKDKTIILTLLDRGSHYITYEVEGNRFMLDTETGGILYPELSNFNSGELIDIAKELHSLWKTNSREFPMFIEVSL